MHINNQHSLADSPYIVYLSLFILKADDAHFLLSGRMEMNNMGGWRGVQMLSVNLRKNSVS